MGARASTDGPCGGPQWRSKRPSCIFATQRGSARSARGARPRRTLSVIRRGPVRDIDYIELMPGLSAEVARFADVASADLAAGLLGGQGIRATAQPVDGLLGAAPSYRVLVHPRQLHRARWTLEASDFTDRELAFLATGQLDGD